MTLPTSGAIDVKAIEGEFDGAGTVTPDPIFDIQYYYRNGPFVSSNNINIPTSGPISFANFYGASNNDVVVIIGSNTTNVNAQTLFGADWTNAAVRKRIIISPNVIVGGSLGQTALTIPTGLANNLYIINYGSIQGYGGSGTYPNGGNAISASSSNVYILNYGTIYAGGGKGGDGGLSNPVTFVNQFGNVNGTVQGKGLGGIGRGYNQTNTNGTVTGGSKWTVKADSRGYNVWYFPPNAEISITMNSSGTVRNYFSSNSTINLRYNSSGVGLTGSGGDPNCGQSSAGCGLHFAGTNSKVTITSNGSSQVSELWGDINQLNVIDTSGCPYYIFDASRPFLRKTASIESDQNPTRATFTATQFVYNLVVPIPAAPSAGGNGGDWGQPGTGTGAGLGGYYIVGNNNVNWISLGTVIGAVG
jgi:hypothetical protein